MSPYSLDHISLRSYVSLYSPYLADLVSQARIELTAYRARRASRSSFAHADSVFIMDSFATHSANYLRNSR